MAMTKKDYEAIAAMISKAKRECPSSMAGIMGLQIELTRYFGETNSSFKPETFYDACLGVK